MRIALFLAAALLSISAMAAPFAVQVGDTRLALDAPPGFSDVQMTGSPRLLEQVPHGSYPGGREWRVDANRFPVSTTVTGVVLDLDPGALRELHWHPNADEWQYLIEGRAAVTMFGSHGRFRVETLEQGDVGYIPQGYGHSIENIGDRRCRVLIGLNSGTYQGIDLSQWIAGNPADVLATNFSQKPELFAKFPHHDVFLAGKDGP